MSLEVGPCRERARVLDAIEEDLAVEVIDLVLEGACGESLHVQLDVVAVAIPRAHVGTKFARGKRVALFWELYGKAPVDSALPMSLTITPVDEGFLRRAFRVLRISPKVSPLNIRWQENGAEGMRSARSVLLDLSLVPAGKYTVKLEVGNSRAGSASRTIEIQ